MGRLSFSCEARGSGIRELGELAAQRGFARGRIEPCVVQPLQLAFDALFLRLEALPLGDLRRHAGIEGARELLLARLDAPHLLTRAGQPARRGLQLSAHLLQLIAELTELRHPVPSLRQHFACVHGDEHGRLEQDVRELGGAHVPAPRHLPVVLMLRRLLIVFCSGRDQRERRLARTRSRYGCRPDRVGRLPTRDRSRHSFPSVLPCRGRIAAPRGAP